MARLRTSAKRDPDGDRRRTIQAAARWAGSLHGVTAPREDWHGTVRPLTGPCRLRVVGGEIVPTDEPGTDEENERTLSALDDETLLRVTETALGCTGFRPPGIRW